MTQTCPVKITWNTGTTSVTLVSAGDWIGEPLTANGRQEVLDVAGIGVAESYFRALGGAALDLRFTLERDEDTTSAAAAKLIDLQASWLGLDGKSGTLTIASTDEDDEWTLVFTPCVFVDITPDLPGDTGAATLRRKLRFLAAPPNFTQL
jgi:hypothetical protein